MIEAYGALKADRSAATRTTFLIGPDGRVVKVWDKVKVAGHAKEVCDSVPAGPGGQDREPP